MFKKLKDKLEEEFKQGPLKLPVSVQQLAQVISPSPSLNSLSDNNPSSSATYTSDPSNVSTDFFSIGDDDDSQDGSSKTLPLHSIDLTATSPSNMTQNRSRRSSLSSVTSEASSLFPIYENPSGSNYFQSDFESEMEDGMPSQLEKISKEQLYQSYKKMFNRYNKYKIRYVDLQRHYKELLHDNVKTKNVLQESQDKALRRIAELKEQCQLEQNAKAHLEESLRNDVEDRDHMITTLKTKISLLRGGGGNEGHLVEVNDEDEIGDEKKQLSELEKLKLENENLQREICDLKKLKDTACNLIHRCDSTIDEATDDADSENLKRKMSELKSEIQKMKAENESLSYLLSKNIITEEDKRPHVNLDGNLLIDLSGIDTSQGDQRSDEKDKKIEKLNNLLLKCKEKISSLTTETKSKNLIIEDKNKKLKEVTGELETNKKSIAKLTAELEALKVREEENVLSVAENKMAIHKELETKEEQIRALTKELKTSENEFRKEKDEIIKKYEERLTEMTEDFRRELKYKKEENEKLSEDLNSKIKSSGYLKNNEASEIKDWETEFRKMVESIVTEKSYESFLESKSAEIERASFKLEERLSSMQRNLIELVQTKQRELEKSHRKMKELIEEKDRRINDFQRSIATVQEESSQKWNLEVQNAMCKMEALESALSDSKQKNEELVLENNEMLEEQEKLKSEVKCVEMLKQRVADLKSENERVKKERTEAAAENERLSKELRQQCEKLKTVEVDNHLLEKIDKEKVEAEKKLREYIENYKKLEKENQALGSDLNQKCDKLLTDLNESKEKIRILEGENKDKIRETEGLKNELGEVRMELEQTLLRLRTLQSELQETSEAKGKMNVQYQNASADLSSLKKEHSDVIKEKSVIEEENARLKKELLTARERLKEADEESVKVIGELSKEVNELETMKRELSSEVRNLNEKMEVETGSVEQLRAKLEEKKALEEEVMLLKVKNRELEESLLKMERDYEIEKVAAIEKVENESLKKELSAVRDRAEELDMKRCKENEKLKLEVVESEKVKSELTEKLREAIKVKNEMSDSLEMKVNELETLKRTLDSTREELTAKVTQLEEEKRKVTSESENKLNVLKNEIKFMNNKFEEDIGNMEENRSAEMNQLNMKLVVAEKASDELLQKLERITTERDEAKVAVEERDLKIAEMENCMSNLKADMDRNFSEGQLNEGCEKHEQEVKNTVMKYESELMRREKELHKLQKQLEEYSHLIQNFKTRNESLKVNENPEAGEKEVEEVLEQESRRLSNAEPDGLQFESETIESIRKKLIQQSGEMKELKKQHKREVTELRKILSVRRKSRRNSAEGPDWGGTLDNDTEHEYLRNILYEYMMGREQLVLAKVLSAIVKFDKQQTRNVLEKEQHRQTLFGQLGIL